MANIVAHNGKRNNILYTSGSLGQSQGFIIKKKKRKNQWWQTFFFQFCLKKNWMRKKDFPNWPQYKNDGLLASKESYEQLVL